MGGSASAMLGCSWVCAGLREDVCWCAMSAEVQKIILIVQGCLGVMLGCVRDCEEICFGMYGWVCRCVRVCIWMWMFKGVLSFALGRFKIIFGIPVSSYI